MELLEPKDLTIYLPHKLHVQFAGGIYTLRGINGNSAIFRRWWMPSVPIKHVVPLVRPLTYLTKPIIHNGNKFVPFNILAKYNAVGYHFNLKEHELAEVIRNGQLDMGKMPRWMVEMCAAWHFDVNHLLQKKLANHLM